MADYKDDLALIVRYDGTKADFDGAKNDYLGKVVFIYGSKTEAANQEEQSNLVQAIWVSDANGGRYLDMANVEYIRKNLTHISGIKVDATTYYPSSGGGAIELKGAEGIRVIVNSQTGEVIFSGAGLKTDLIGTSINGSDVTAYPNTITGAKKYTDKVASDLKGTKAVDDNTEETIRGAKDYADAKVSDAKAELKGTKAVGDNTEETIRGAKDYADNKAAAAVAESNAYADTMKTQAVSTSVVSVDTTTTTEGASKSYTFKQGGVTITTIDIPKDLVVSKGSVVTGTWNGDNFTESTTGVGTGTAIKLVLSNDDTLYINAATLVDVYTAQQSAAEVQLAIDPVNNEISATIVEGAVTEAKIATDAVTTSKIKNGSVTKGKLEQTVQSSLDKADSAIVSLGGDNYIEVDNVGTTTTDKKITAKTAEITSETATADGLATVADIRAYLKARFSVKVVS